MPSPTASSSDESLPIWRKAFAILTPSQRREATWLIGLMLVGTILETFSLGMVVPILGVMGTLDVSQTFPPAARLLEWLGNPPQHILIAGGLAAMLLIYVVKAAYLVFLAQRQSRFLTSVSCSLGQRLFETYIGQPWSFHLRRNSADLSHVITLQVRTCCQTFATIIFGGTDILNLAGIAALLLAIQPIGAMTLAGVLAISTTAFQRMTRPRLTRWGKLWHENERLRSLHLLQGLGCVKDMKIRGVENEFATRYRVHDAAVARASERIGLFNQLPRLYYELVAVFGLCLLAASMIVQGTPRDVFIPTLGLFATAAFRMLPSANRLLATFQQVQSTKPAIETLYRELQLPHPDFSAQGGRLRFSTAVVLDDVHFAYPGAAEETLRGVSLRIPRGAAVGFIGESGSGKSTLVDVILGLLAATRGRVLVDAVDIDADPRPWQNIVGYVPQSIYLCDDSLRRNVAFGLPDDAIDEAAVRRAVQAAQLETFVASLPDGLDTSVGERGVRLSGGQRQRIGIARALYHDPEVLVLDEATSALDADTERDVMEAVDALQGTKTLIIVAHRLTTLSKCDTIHRLRDGRIVASGSFAEVTAG